MPNPDIQQLRAEARARHRAVTKKISRLKSVKDVDIAGTKADPRRDLNALKSYNSRQLKAYIASMNAFTSRKTQFVPDVKRQPMRQSVWEEYKKLERKRNAKVNADFEKVADIYNPRRGMTIRQRMDMITPVHRTAYDPAVNSPFRPSSRGSRNAASEQALKKLITEKKRQLRPDYNAKQAKAARKQFDQMARVINRHDITSAIKTLSNDQFMLIWNYDVLATAMSLSYEAAQAYNTDQEQAFHSDATEQSMREVSELITWARTLKLGG